jgi:hypothetical protein
MKKLRLLGLAAFLLAGTLLFNSCIGSFNLTKKLYSWNNEIGSKWANEAVFLLFVIIPVYEATLFIDYLILNSIEFWGGSNPVSMEEGEEEIQYVKSGNKEYSITATKNKFVIEQLRGPQAGELAEILFVPEEQSCYLNYRGESTKLLEYVSSPDGNDKVNVFLPDGRIVCMDAGERDPMMIQAALRSGSQYMARK